MQVRVLLPQLTLTRWVTRALNFMNTLLTGGINLTKIPKELLRKDKNGNIWLNIATWIRGEIINKEPDQYGNIASIQISQTKEQREAKESKIYIANLKEADKKEIEQTFIIGGSKFDSKAYNDFENLPF
jgi:hypothetical protein